VAFKVVIAVAGLLATALVEPAVSGPALSVARQAILVDGRPAFLTGVSVFDALGTVAPRDADLDALKGWGVNTVRVWAHWHEPIYQSDGTLTADGQARLLALVRRLQSRGLILELVLLRPGQLPGQPFPVFASEAARARALEAVTLALRPFRNVLFDLYNEHDHPDGPITHAAARALRDKVKAIDGARVVTISSTEFHLVSPKGEIDDAHARNVREEATNDAGSVAVDMVAPHFPRTDDWAAATAARIGAVRAALDRIGSRVPIYLSEERRADGSARIQPSAYRVALANASSAGAAGWVFHTAAGFELKKTPFLDALAAEERAGLQTLRRP
jgi:Cellulase (glycosyl hydrolase family 5)